MAKKNNKSNQTFVASTAQTITKVAVKTNDFALKSTEGVLISAIEKADKLQQFTASTLKKGFEFSEKKQDVIFDSLESVKKFILKRFTKN